MPELDTLFREHHERVFNAAFRVTGNAADAEDVLQTVFMRVLRRGATPDQPTPLTAVDASAAYLCRAAINASLDLLRDGSRRRGTGQESAELLRDEAAPSADLGVHRSQLRDRLRSALATLSPRAAEMFALRYFEDFTNVAIAEMLGTSASVVAVTLHRARAELQELLALDNPQS